MIFWKTSSGKPQLHDFASVENSNKRLLLKFHILNIKYVVVICQFKSEKQFADLFKTKFPGLLQIF